MRAPPAAARRVAGRELADAEDQYARDVQRKGPEIADAENEAARQRAKAAKELGCRAPGLCHAGAGKCGQTQARLQRVAACAGQGEAVATVKGLREREDAGVGVFSDTEDPEKIFEFWTADEAGGPEISIAAKTGVTVQQPDARFFPHFRSNIFLYNPEGQVLVRVMESIAERHAALTADLGERKAAAELETANWESVRRRRRRLDSARERVLRAREAAIERLSEAKAHAAQADKALTPMRARDAFEHSPKAREWAERGSGPRPRAPLGHHQPLSLGAFPMRRPHPLAKRNARLHWNAAGR